MKKVVVFGGGTGISNLLSGLKLFPLDVTTVIAVSDNGSSTGVLKEELDIPAVGDIGKVLLSMANVDSDFVDLLRYRFSKEGSLHNHPVRNIMLAALIDTKGSLTEATKYMAKILRVKGTVLPLTEEKVELVGIGEGEKYFGEESVSQNVRNIEKLAYDHEIHIGKEIKNAIKEADLLIFSPGSLYTSILPHLLSKEVVKAVNAAKAPVMYVSNLVSQPGETDGYSVGDHIEVINKYLNGRKVDVVVANSGDVDGKIRKKYLDTEGKTIVPLTGVEGIEVIADNIFSIEDERIRHDALKTAYLIFSYMMRQDTVR
ncbi:MAG: uridine diphosphate-N-acetylglucosamine-binding protein YvcK [Lachnospiraceae bacterium]|nr:uridine diphosphate-N-acetylglucosamine-binding protein YvcK [Lachnospiraceae bacterium]